MRLGIVTDVHLCPPGSPPAVWHNPYDLDGAARRLSLALERLEQEAVDAVAVLGDLTSRADAASVDLGLRLLSATPLPLRLVPGNHDHEHGGVDLDERVIAQANSSLRAAEPAGEIIGGVRLAGVGIGRDGDGVWTVGPVEPSGWGAAPVVLLTHSPLLDIGPKVEGAGLKNAGTFADPAGVGAILGNRPGPTVVLHGHYHVRDAEIAGPILQIGCAALIEPPNEVAVLDVDVANPAVAVRVRRLPIEPVAAERLPVLVPARQAWRFVDEAWRETALE